MRQLMKYYIVSGNVVETRVSFLPIREGGRKPRGIRRAGASSMRKIMHNEKQEYLRLGRTLNANFPRGYLITFKYGEGKLPASYEELCRNGAALCRKLTALCRKHGVEIKRVLINANWSPKRKAPARYHHHLVVNEIPLELVRQLWPEGEIDIRSLRHGDLTDLAAYLYKNVKAEAGKKHWSPSRNLDKPIYTEPVPVRGADDVQAPAGASQIYQEPGYDEDGRQVGSYLRCVLPEPPKVRGGQIILPKPPKRGGRKQ